MTPLLTDPQDIYNHVRDHLMAQGVRSVRVGKPHLCAYRGVNGTKCAIGCLIPDELYDRRFESYNIARLLEDVPEMRAAWGPHWEMLATLQRIHDIEPVEKWPQALWEAAVRCHLVP